MRGAISIFLQYAFMVWCSVEAQGLYLFTLSFTGGGVIKEGTEMGRAMNVRTVVELYKSVVFRQ
jgi:hypothetical protein